MDKRTKDEFINWASGHILTQLIAGKLYSGVWMVLASYDSWKKDQDILKQQENKKNKKKVK